jgi:hypothetical protein
MASEYKETVARRYYTVTGEHAEESKIEALISSGESETFLQKAIQRDQGRGEVLSTLSEIQERHDAVKDIERSLLELHQVFLEMAALVEAQGHQLNDIETHVARASSFVHKGTVELQSAKVYQKIEQPKVGLHRHRRRRRASARHRAAHHRQPQTLGRQIDPLDRLVLMLCMLILDVLFCSLDCDGDSFYRSDQKFYFRFVVLYL